MYGWDNVASRPIFSSDHGATWTPIVTGSGAVDVEENDVLVVSAANPLDFVSDIAGGKPFAEVIDDGGGGVEIEVDKQIDYGPLAGGVGPVPTGFTFDATIYVACEVIYYLLKVTGELESGHIMMVHDGTNAGVVVVKRDSTVLPFTQGDPAVQFSADVNAGDCRLLYTETNGDELYLSVKPRPIRPPQIITIEFESAGSSVLAAVPTDWTWNIVISTSDGLPTRQQASVDVVDLLTGSADGLDYTMATPQNLVFPPGTVDGSTFSAGLSVLGNNENDDVDTGLQNVVGAILGAQTTHRITLLGAVA